MLQMVPPITSTTTSHVTTRGNHVTAPAHASLLKTSVRSSASAAQSVSINMHTLYQDLYNQIFGGLFTILHLKVVNI